jgi:ribosomal protein S5
LIASKRFFNEFPVEEETDVKDPDKKREIPVSELIPFTKLDKENFKRITLEVGRHVNITAQGRVFSFSALVLQGNDKGSGSIGYGKASNVQKAMDNAVRDGYKKMQTIYRFENRTIAMPIKADLSFCSNK